MSKLILSSLVRSSSRTLKLNNIILSRNSILNEYQACRTFVIKNDCLLKNNFLRFNQTSYRFIESDENKYQKQANAENKDELNKSENSKNDETVKKSTTKKRLNQFNFSWRTLYISSAIAAVYFGIVYYLRELKENEWEKDRQRTLGKAAIGGAFELVDTDNKPVTNKDFLGKWCLIYFGFTHCPDVCPEEVEKMVNVYHKVKNFKTKDEIVPIFVSVDPDRDTPEMVKKYCAEFSPHIIGLTGNKEQIKKMCKNYRVYFSPGPKSADKDYIVDHTIIMYLINPDGEFVDYYGQTRDAEMIANAVLINMKKFNKIKKGSWLG